MHLAAAPSSLLEAAIDRGGREPRRRRLAAVASPGCRRHGVVAERVATSRDRRIRTHQAAGAAIHAASSHAVPDRPPELYYDGSASLELSSDGSASPKLANDGSTSPELREGGEGERRSNPVKQALDVDGSLK